ncbi:porin family protein [Persicobacter psychrovividus]|uniref:Outer membrane protein beta-barrel domain-containing protein n=1 Tax=Persicobacter psychrovividus TaxID=387638 RepID=A0ABN6LF32_9BACT|nr:hypothetical protein PEPS_40650 [Persicobacter psychrovividus]
MKTIYLLLSLCLCILFIQPTQAQTDVGAGGDIQLGLKFSPVFSYSRIDNSSPDYDISRGGTGTKFAFGLVADLPFGANYYFSTGLIYLPKGAKIDYTNKTTGESGTEKYKTHYLQVPLTIKLRTNEIAESISGYAQLGTAVDFKINDDTGGDKFIVEKFFFMDVSLVVGGGIMYDLPFGNTIGLGIMYQRGLINAARDGQDIRLKKDLLVLDATFYF